MTVYQPIGLNLSHSCEPVCMMREFTWSDAIAEQGADFRPRARKRH